MHWQLTWNFKFNFGFFNVFLLEKYYIFLYKNSLLKCSWRAFYAPFAVLRYIYATVLYLFIYSISTYWYNNIERGILGPPPEKEYATIYYNNGLPDPAIPD